MMSASGQSMMGEQPMAGPHPQMAPQASMMQPMRPQMQYMDQNGRLMQQTSKCCRSRFCVICIQFRSSKKKFFFYCFVVN